LMIRAGNLETKKAEYEEPCLFFLKLNVAFNS
jgi:hypothetical protein